ncbi:hypothetical protein FB645_004197 [Coemansia sp. IMI 203386]|nr:hypothetical protein FB645_004197 [Coemansia sp. IMI 203386]
MRCYAVLAGIVSFLAVSGCAAPCRQLYRRQDLVDTSLDLQDTAADVVGAVDVVDGTTEPLASDNINNLVGNSQTTIDDSVNLTDNSIEYPDDSELTGNTGTAVSGNNNDIMPIINAPVTVIINGAGNSGRQNTGQIASSATGQPAAGAWAEPQQQQQQRPMQRTAQQPFQQPLQQQPVFQAANPEPILAAPQVAVTQPQSSPIDANLQKLIEYALMVSQNNLASKLTGYP